MRTRYDDGRGGKMGLRLGKSIAQSGHATIAFLLEKFQTGILELTPIEQEWVDSGQVKICVGVESDEELLEVYNKAIDSGLKAFLITDHGKTELVGKNRTAVAIGPDDSEKIDRITGKLKLL